MAVASNCRLSVLFHYLREDTLSRCADASAAMQYNGLWKWDHWILSPVRNGGKDQLEIESQLDQHPELWVHFIPLCESYPDILMSDGTLENPSGGLADGAKKIRVPPV